MKRRKDISEVVEIPQKKTTKDVSEDVKISRDKALDDVIEDVKISQNKALDDVIGDEEIYQDNTLNDASEDVKISLDKALNDVSEDEEIYQDNTLNDENEDEEIIVVSSIDESSQDKKRKTIKKVIIAVVVSIISLILLAVAGVVIYLNSVGINYIETENDNSNNSILVEDFEENIEEIFSNESESLLEEDIEEILGENSNIIIGEEFDIIIEEAEKPTKPSAEKPTKPSAEKPTKPSAEKPTKPSAEKTTKPSSSSNDDDIITAVRDNSDLSASLYKWYKNGGAHMSSKNILNILIVGIDATGGKRMKGNSDVMMLASINKESGKIILCSFLRDSYSYFEDSSGTGYYKKLNNAYFYGSANCLLDAIEKNYKINIDHFVAVDFEAFKQVIDLIGGVDLNITKEEAEAIKITMDKPGDEVPYGKNVVLNGEQALAYSRIRKLYSSGDIQRTQNQRKVINAIIKKSKTLSLSEMNGVVQKLGKYIYTDCSSTKIISLGTSALLGKWYNFKIYSMDAPPESARAVYESPTSWLWVVDYPSSAQYVQKQIYGKSNIAIR